MVKSKSAASTPETGSLNVTVQLTLAELVGLLPARVMELTVGAPTSLKVTVTDWAALPMLKLQLLPVQPVTPADCEVQLASTAPVPAVAVNVPTSLLPNETVHVPVQVKFCVGSVVSAMETEPTPVPAKVIVRFFAATT
jgi:hypothetical protein